MAPIQQTFSLIPEPPSAINGGGESAGRLSRPPMTTKQAKKAYKAKSKGPKLSKAEQRRQDLMEQDRIRREFEKERNQARAKTARDKRKEKEDREKSEKKRKGLPLVEVHPSQDTIARFVRKPKLSQSQQPAPRPSSESRAEAAKSPEQESTSKPQDVAYIRAGFPEELNAEKPLSARDELERPAKRHRVGVSPRLLSAAEHMPEDMFNKPEPLSEKRPTKAPGISPTGVAIAPTLEAAAKASNSEPHDSSPEMMVNQHILNESFSVDDGLFDDIDVDAFELKAVPEEAAKVGRDEPPPKSAGPPPMSVGQEIQVHAHPKTRIVGETGLPGKTNLSDPANVSHQPTARPKHLMIVGSIGAASKTHVPATPTRVGENLSTTPPKNNRTSHARDSRPPTKSDLAGSKYIESATTTGGHQHGASASSRSEEANNDQPLQTHSSKRPCSGFSAVSTSRQLRGILLVAEEQKQKPLQEFIPNQYNGAKSIDAALVPAVEGSGEERLPEKMPKPPFRNLRAPVLIPNSPCSPRTPVMGPPPLPPKSRTNTQPTSVGSGIGPKYLTQSRPACITQGRQPKSSAVTQEIHTQMLPSSTQLLLLSDAVDLFPSPSQEAAEIFDGVTNGGQPPSGRPKTAAPPPSSMLPARCDRPRTASDMSRVAAPKLAARNFDPNFGQDSRVEPTAQAQCLESPAVKLQVPTVPMMEFMPFLSTQDVSFSSQDIKELEEETRSPSRPLQAARDQTIMDGLSSVSQPAPKIIRPHHCDAPTTPASKQYMRGTSVVANSSTIMRAQSTQDRILGPNYESQYSNSLPETPSGPHSRVNDTSCRNFCGVTHGSQQMMQNKEIASPGSLLTDDIIAELLKEDLDIVHNEPRQQIKADNMLTTTVAQKKSTGIRPSPNPFFTSSGTKERVYLAMEKTRTASLADEHTRRQAHEDLNVLLRQEDEKQERLMLEKMLEAEEQDAQQLEQEDKKQEIKFLERMLETEQGCTGQPRPGFTGSPSDHQVSKRTLATSQQNAGGRQAHSQHSNTGIERNRRRSQPQSSFERMLAMLEKSRDDHDATSASQDSDYGDVAWDDDELLGL